MSKKPNKTSQYKLANEEFLKQKAQEDGIIALESGIHIFKPFRIPVRDYYCMQRTASLDNYRLCNIRQTVQHCKFPSSVGLDFHP